MDHTTRQRRYRAPRPNFTAIPNIFLDEWAPTLTEGELRVALYIMRRTFGFQRDRDAISFSQLCEGITREDGTKLDHGTGMARTSVSRAVKSLETKGMLRAIRAGDAKRGKETTVYELLFMEEEPSSATLPAQYSNATAPGSVRDAGVVALRYQQKTVPKESQKEDQHLAVLDGHGLDVLDVKRRFKGDAGEWERIVWQAGREKDTIGGHGLIILARLVDDFNAKRRRP